MKKVVLKLITFYQSLAPLRKTIKKNLFLPERSCRFLPTCSDYIYQAIQKYGVKKGSFLGIKRLLRCTPLSQGGYDPIP